jgi:hypothetical protein
MYNINNLYTIDTVQDLSQESAAAIQGGAAVELYLLTRLRFPDSICIVL